MKKFLSVIFQVAIDITVGMAIYFLLTTFAPMWSASIILVITLAATAFFAEIWEVRFKGKE